MNYSKIKKINISLKYRLKVLYKLKINIELISKNMNLKFNNYNNGSNLNNNNSNLILKD